MPGCRTRGDRGEHELAHKGPVERRVLAVEMIDCHAVEALDVPIRLGLRQHPGHRVERPDRAQLRIASAQMHLGRGHTRRCSRDARGCAQAGVVNIPRHSCGPP